MSVCSPWTDAEAVAKCCDGSSCDAEEIITAASEILFVLSGRQFAGECEATIRPCGPYECSCACGHRWLHGVRTRGGCCCPPEIILSPGPATEITEIKIDGAIVPADSYRLDPGSRLVRLEVDGSNDGWPCCNRLDRPDTEADTFSIEYTYGVAVPQVGINAAAELACELGKACSGAKDCRLPQRVTNITRQGVSLTLLDPQDFLDKGRVGLYEVDLFLSAFNPNQLTSRAQIFNPDTFRSTRRVS